MICLVLLARYLNQFDHPLCGAELLIDLLVHLRVISAKLIGSVFEDLILNCKLDLGIRDKVFEFSLQLLNREFNRIVLVIEHGMDVYVLHQTEKASSSLFDSRIDVELRLVLVCLEFVLAVPHLLK